MATTSSENAAKRTTTATTPRRSSSVSAIRVLPQNVVDRIAAGEAIHHPASAAKELLENSFDAGSTEVVVSVRIGNSSHSGNNNNSSSINSNNNSNNVSKSITLSVSDNGCGIRRDDMALAATRHATSKLRDESDLLSLQSFGFRGEALASMSLVSRRVSIVSRTADSNVAYRQLYKDGAPMVSQKQQQQLGDSTASNESDDGNSCDPPQPCARKPGTTVVCHDLFEDAMFLRQRHRSMRPAEEYAKILQVAQYYAIHKSSEGIAVVCEKKQDAAAANGGGGSSSGTSKKAKGSGGAANASKLDLNTRNACPAVSALQRQLLRRQQQAPSTANTDTSDATAINKLKSEATKQAILHVFGSKLLPHVHEFSCQLQQQREKDDDGEDGHESSKNSRNAMSYRCRAFVSLATYNANNKSTCIFMINHRLVECQTLKRAIEAVYGEFSNSQNTNPKPWCYLSIEVPPHHVDCNVHPSKQQVTLLYMTEICQHFASVLRQEFLSVGQAFQRGGGGSSKDNTGPALTADGKSKHVPSIAGVKNPYQQRREPVNQQQSSQNGGSNKRKHGEKDELLRGEQQRQPPQSLLSMMTQQPPPKKKAVPPSRLIRTKNATQPGALEPFLVPTQSSQHHQSVAVAASQQSLSSSPLSLTQQSLTDAFSSSQSSQERSPTLASVSGATTQQGHDPNCPLSSVARDSNSMDLSQPGAFAVLASGCTCRWGIDAREAASTSQVVRVPRQAVPRPRKITPTQCGYKSIGTLRKRLERKTCPELQKQLRSAYFVGVVSQHRSLVQFGEELVLLNHYECARNLFYQLALYRFAEGSNAAKFQAPVDIRDVIAQALEFEERMQQQRGGRRQSASGHGGVCEEDEGISRGSTPEGNVMTTNHLLSVSDTNNVLAEQAGECLFQNAEMLEEYFAIRIEKNHDDDGDGRIQLSGLPVLLDGYAPSPHALPIFLLRLATEVDFTDELACFRGVCRELGAYYAELPWGADDLGVEGGELHPHVRHVLFPAICTLLKPQQKLVETQDIMALTKLSTLYKVFERC